MSPEKEASALDKQIRHNQAPMVAERVPIKDALDDGIRHSRSRNKGHRENLADNARYFIDFISKAFPGLKYWDDVKYQHLRAYIEDYLQVTVGPKTAKNYVSVVIMTSRHMHRLDPDRYNIIQAVHPWLSSSEPPKKRYLVGHDALDLLDIARTRRSPNASIAVALGAFTGLNLWEIARLQVKDINIADGTVEMRKSKTKHRDRIIPVLPLVMEVLQGRIKRLHAPDDYIVRHRPGNKPSADSLSSNISKHLLPAARAKYGRELKISPKDLRKTCINMLAAAKVPDQWAAAYVGHAAYTTLRQHYLDATVDQLREHVLKPLQVFITRVEETPLGKQPVKTLGELVAAGDIADEE